MGTYNYKHAPVHQQVQCTHHDERHVPGSEKEQSAIRMYLCLPWELRHYIHTFCVQGPYDNEVIVRGVGRSKPPALLVRQSTGTRSYQWTEDPTFLQLSPDRIGLIASREVLETYYRTRTFKFAHEELGFVQSFVETDSFGLSMRPADHIRRLHLQIQPFKYARLREPKSKATEEARCSRALKSLAVLQCPGTIVDVHVDLAQGFSDDEEYEELLDDAGAFVFQIIGLLDTLRKSGLNLELMFEGKWDGRDGMKLCNGSVSSLDDCVTKMKIACQ